MGENDGEKKVKVVDRRWLTPDGDVRDVPEAPTPPSPAEDPIAADPPGDVSDQAENAPGEEAPDAAPDRDSNSAGDAPRLSVAPGFLDLVDLLAQQAMVLLSGQVPGRGRDPQGGRMFIDLLDILKSKTAGNLSLEETNYLDDVLYQLRSLYLAATR